LGDHYRQFKDKNGKELSNDEKVIDTGINENRFIQSCMIDEKNVIGFIHDDIEDNQIKYKVNTEISVECYQKVYDSTIYVNLTE